MQNGPMQEKGCCVQTAARDRGTKQVPRAAERSVRPSGWINTGKLSFLVYAGAEATFDVRLTRRIAILMYTSELL